MLQQATNISRSNLVTRLPTGSEKSDAAAAETAPTGGIMEDLQPCHSMASLAVNLPNSDPVLNQQPQQPTMGELRDV
jgi:hypothetical protein